MFRVPVLELDGEQIRVSFVASVLASVVLDHLDNFPDAAVIAVEVGVITVGDVDADAITDLEPSHYRKHRWTGS
ncbi:hypothetical protein AArcSl_2294 [Halalkaliarchaeum desulfuricum]|uniref:Uncharacterized protein n=1 Tax=Halalkaliarchaeum desulfuricum TaxID=2055893 RepID=A0A343TLE5_9EURY|nr:hypothetical protein AArcSl_2294 [Halalkaliarchaeum desulfuricum]